MDDEIEGVPEGARIKHASASAEAGGHGLFSDALKRHCANVRKHGSMPEPLRYTRGIWQGQRSGHG